MGLRCDIKKEHGGKCTGWDGIIQDEIQIPKNTNGWLALDTVAKKIPCESCRDDGLENLSALHDVVNLTIGETNKAYNPKNLVKFSERVHNALEACTNCHEVD